MQKNHSYTENKLSDIFSVNNQSVGLPIGWSEDDQGNSATICTKILSRFQLAEQPGIVAHFHYFSLACKIWFKKKQKPNLIQCKASRFYQTIIELMGTYIKMPLTHTFLRVRIQIHDCFLFYFLAIKGEREKQNEASAQLAN